MDALAQTLSAIRLTSPLLAKLSLSDDITLIISENEPPPGTVPFHYMLSGSCRLVIGDHVTELRPGDMAMLPRWPPYSLETGRPANTMKIVDLVAQSRQPSWSQAEGLDSPLLLSAGSGPANHQLLSGIFMLDGMQGELLLNDLPDNMHFPGAGDVLGGLMQAALDLIVSETGGRLGYAATASRLLEAILVECVRIWALTADLKPGRLRGLTDPVLAPVIQAIHERLSYKWTATEMAKLGGQSRSAFARRFSAVVSMSPGAYVTDLRCSIAERRLLQNDMPISKLAFDLGYQSSFAFSRAFRKSRGLTPAAYRRRWRSRNTPSRE